MFGAILLLKNAALALRIQPYHQQHPALPLPLRTARHSSRQSGTRMWQKPTPMDTTRATILPRLPCLGHCRKISGWMNAIVNQRLTLFLSASGARCAMDVFHSSAASSSTTTSHG